MSRIHPECPDSDPSDRSVAADVVLRQEPDEEDEEEDEGDGKEDNDDDDNDDDGYSERPSAAVKFLRVIDRRSRLSPDGFPILHSSPSGPFRMPAKHTGPVIEQFWRGLFDERPMTK